MKVTWELDTNNPVDAQILNGMHKLVEFTAAQTQQVAGGTPTTPPAKSAAPTAPAAEVPPAAQPPAAQPQATGKKGGKRAPKAKTKDQLLKMSLSEVVDYLEARKEHNLLECRIVAKHYNDTYAEIDSVLAILHKLGANNFDDLENIEDFISGVCGLCRRKASESTDQGSTDALLGV